MMTTGVVRDSGVEDRLRRMIYLLTHLLLQDKMMNEVLVERNCREIR
jgi:hypothetical protein